MAQEVDREKEEIVKKSPKLRPKPEWMDEPWAVDHKIQKFFPIPYSKKEVFRWFFNRIFGPSKRFKKKTQFIPHELTLNKTFTPDYKIGFVGDIMKMFGYELIFHESIKNFFKDVDLIVGNLEGILTLQPGFVAAQRHEDDIMRQLSDLRPPEKWLLCLSNNHSGDFGIADFIFQLDRLRWEGFNVFGRKDIPNYLYKETLNFVSGSMWSNQDNCNYMSHFDEIDDNFIRDSKIFNILYPHWNYEYELYPRPKIMKKAKQLLKKWDLIFGHHPHVVQPITRIDCNGINKLLAYSGGNFAAGLPVKAHKYGLIMKCDIGQLLSNKSQLAVGNVEWRFTKANNDQKLKYKKNMRKPVDGPIMSIEITSENDFFPDIK